MKGCIRICAASPRVRPADVRANVGEISSVYLRERGRCAAVLFPELSITGYTPGDLLLRPQLLEDAEKALGELALLTEGSECVLIAGLPVAVGSSMYNCAAVLAHGEICGLVPKSTLPDYDEYYESRWFEPAGSLAAAEIGIAGKRVPIGNNLLFAAGGGFVFAVEICEDMWSACPNSDKMASAGALVVFNMSASTDYLGKNERRKRMVLGRSERLECAYVLASAGIGESGADAVFGGSLLVAYAGALLAEGELFLEEGNAVSAPVDLEQLSYHRRASSSLGRADFSIREVRLDVTPPESDPECVSKRPFFDAYAACGFAERIVEIQAAALARRMRSAKIERLVIGVSGGADSALALIGAAAALRRLGKPMSNLTGVVMPGFGSTVRTQSNAKKLVKSFGCGLKVVDIRAACKRHLRDIGYDGDGRDVTFENVQARERTQILMDMANRIGALVVGTGDLSEIALGWSTFSGDHLSMYCLNSSVPKTMVYEALKVLGKDSPVIADIAKTPASPELLPGGEAGETERRIGPYELHDFFLYHYLRNGAERDKLLLLAKTAFSGDYGEETIEKTLDVFLRRFRLQQFKRNCIPDGPKITLSLSSRADWRMPDDLFG